MAWAILECNTAARGTISVTRSSIGCRGVTRTAVTTLPVADGLVVETDIEADVVLIRAMYWVWTRNRSKQRWGAEEGAFRYEAGRKRDIFEKLNMQSMLSPGI